MLKMIMLKSLLLISTVFLIMFTLVGCPSERPKRIPQKRFTRTIPILDKICLSRDYGESIQVDPNLIISIEGYVNNGSTIYVKAGVESLSTRVKESPREIEELIIKLKKEIKELEDK